MGRPTNRRTLAGDHRGHTTERWPMLLVVCGLPGAGKTTIAEAVADRVDGRLVRTDVVRKDLFPDPDYTEAEKLAVYGELLGRGREVVEAGGTAVLDGTFKEARFRGDVVDLAAELGVDFRLVKVECDEAVARRRIRERTDDESDADPDLHSRFRELFDPIECEHAVVDNSGDLDATLARVDELFPVADPSSVPAGE
ncbi:AAA family ATPase [Haloarchaeobius iranensis]|nr:AAA family ATPase [Haloarchaeobius iranensis]